MRDFDSYKLGLSLTPDTNWRPEPRLSCSLTTTSHILSICGSIEQNQLRSQLYGLSGVTLGGCQSFRFTIVLLYRNLSCASMVGPAMQEMANANKTRAKRILEQYLTCNSWIFGRKAGTCQPAQKNNFESRMSGQQQLNSRVKPAHYVLDMGYKEMSEPDLTGYCQARTTIDYFHIILSDTRCKP